MIVFSSATSRRNCSTSSLVAPAGADSTPWAWASEPGATKNSTRSAKRVVSERMFFLSQKDLAESRCPAPDTQEHYVKLSIELSTAAVGSAQAQATNRPHNAVVAGEVKRQRNRSMWGRLVAWAWADPTATAPFAFTDVSVLAAMPCA